MSDYGRLAFTGLPTLAVFGVVIDQWWIAAIVLGLFAAGVFLIRYGWRHKRAIDAR